MKLDINLIWAVVVLLVAGMATVYSLNKQKLEKIKLIHPKLATVLETAGELALKATTYQASLDGKEGAKKLYDATDEVYNQLKRLYPNVPIDRDTVRNYVQHAYDFDIKNSQPKTNVKLDGSDLASHMQSVLGSTNVIADSIDKK